MIAVLRTDRLLLRRFTAGDEDALVELDADPDVMRYLTGGAPTPREVVREELLAKAGMRLIRTFHPSWDDPIDGAEHGEVEYALSKAQWQRAAPAALPAP